MGGVYGCVGRLEALLPWVSDHRPTRAGYRRVAILPDVPVRFRLYTILQNQLTVSREAK